MQHRTADKQRLLELMLEAERRRQQERQRIPVREERGGSFPLSFSQERLWFLDQLGLVGSAYNVPMTIRLAGDLIVPALERSFTELVARHESLRTHFGAHDGVPFQQIDSAGVFQLRCTDISEVSDANERERQLQEQLREERALSFDLSKAPPMRVLLVTLGAREHLLAITIHHIASDGWSSGVLLAELSRLYAGIVEQRPAELPALPVQYADFSAWQREHLNEATLQNDVEYWRQQLHGAPAYLQMPTDRPRPAIETFRGAMSHFDIPAGLRDALADLARREGATPFMVFVAAFNVLLYRWSGRSDIVIGSPIAGRTVADVEGLIGFFINMLPLRTQVQERASFRELLNQVKEVTLGAYSHQELPFDVLVRELRPERNLGGQPVFQAALALQNYPEQRFDLPGLTWTVLEDECSTTLLDLSLYLYDCSEGMKATFQYSTDLFEAATIAQLARQLRALLEGIVANADSSVAALPLMRDEEKQKVLRQWNCTEHEYPANKCVQDLFRDQALRTPDSLAVVQDGQTLTYRALEQQANRLAHRLRACGVGPETVVALCADRSPETVVGLLGILKAGGAYLPLDPDYPQERLRFLIKDSRASLLLTRPHFANRFVGSPVRNVWLDSSEDDSVLLNADPPESGVRPSNLAYLIYTSGSTGTPKPVAMSHAPLCSHLSWMKSQFALSPDDVVLQKTPLSFDASVWEVFAPLVSGARLVLAPPGAHKDPVCLCRAVAEEGVTVLQLVPSMLQLVASEAAFASCKSLRQLFSGGEVLTAEARDLVLERLDVELHNLYGPTETCIQVASYSCNRRSARSTGPSVPIGRPVWNTQLYVLDLLMQPVPPGVPGELYVGGLQLARGFRGHPELTAGKFVPNPFGAPGSRLYRTGDRVRQLPDGNFEFLGRVDGQVKIRGYRIEPSEIEAVLLEHPAVKEAAVTAHEDAPGELRLVAYVASRERDEPEGVAESSLIARLREYSSSRVPEFMVPSAWMVLKEMPRTASGKIDRRSLPAPQNRPAAAGSYVAPLAGTEEELSRLWAALLHTTEVGAQDNFFALGGHSLHVMKLTARVFERFGVRLSPIVVFQNPTVRAMAAAIERAPPSRKERPGGETAEIEQGVI